MKIKHNYTRVDKFLKEISEKQWLFIYSKDGYVFNKGHLKGRLVNELYEIDSEGLMDFLENLYDHEETNHHTKFVIRDVIKMINYKKSTYIKK